MGWCYSVTPFALELVENALQRGMNHHARDVLHESDEALLLTDALPDPLTKLGGEKTGKGAIRWFCTIKLETDLGKSTKVLLG
jgi:hypothetical protein